jgi:hypothetical protein
MSKQIKSGTHGKYGWVELDETSLHLVNLILTAHKGLRLYITSFDSGPIHPTKEEIRQGWASHGQVMESPVLEKSTIVPYDNFDEWYFFGQSIPFPLDQEVFVNYGGFSLVPVEIQLENFDPSWERDALEWLKPVQERFWAQITRIDPLTYVAMGDRDLVVSKNTSLLASICENA